MRYFAVAAVFTLFALVVAGADFHESGKAHGPGYGLAEYQETWRGRVDAVRDGLTGKRAARSGGAGVSILASKAAAVATAAPDRGAVAGGAAAVAGFGAAAPAEVAEPKPVQVRRLTGGCGSGKFCSATGD